MTAELLHQLRSTILKNCGDTRMNPNHVLENSDSKRGIKANQWIQTRGLLEDMLVGDEYGSDP